MLFAPIIQKCHEKHISSISEYLEKIFVKVSNTGIRLYSTGEKYYFRACKHILQYCWSCKIITTKVLCSCIFYSVFEYVYIIQSESFSEQKIITCYYDNFLMF
jgi:hypothetical protein